MIWIRTQCKETLKECSGFELDFYGGFGIVADSYLRIGTYSTKEKALKVLDMIQEEVSHIQCIYPAGGYNPIMVKKAFQMPQDDEVEA